MNADFRTDNPAPPDGYPSAIPNLDDVIEQDLRQIEAELFELQDYEPGHVSTRSICLLLLTVLAWEFEFVVVLVHAFAKKILDPLCHGVMLIFWGLVALMTWFGGKRAFHGLAHRRGRILITGTQAAIVMFVMVSFGLVVAFIFVRLIEH